MRSARVREQEIFIFFKTNCKKILTLCHLSCPLSLNSLQSTHSVNSTFSNLYWYKNISFHTPFLISFKIQLHLKVCLIVTATDCEYLWFNERLYWIWDHSWIRTVTSWGNICQTISYIGPKNVEQFLIKNVLYKNHFHKIAIKTKLRLL